MSRTWLAAGVLLLVCGCGDADNAGTDPSNTGQNERDADGDTKTPFDQSNEQADLDLVAKIRAEVLEIEDLSVSGQNVKIITNDGRVVLRGPVASVGEKSAIEKVATNAAGAGKVTNQLEVDAD